MCVTAVTLLSATHEQNKQITKPQRLIPAVFTASAKAISLTTYQALPILPQATKYVYCVRVPNLQIN